MKKRIGFAIFTFTALAAAAAAPMSKPWSIVESGDASEVRKEAPAAITKVDGESTRDPRKSDLLVPGKHKVTVRFDTGRAVVADNARDIEIRMDPCKRYRVVAVYKSKTVPDWEPRVYPEIIGECMAKFF